MYDYKTKQIVPTEFKTEKEKFQYYDYLNNVTYYNIMDSFSNEVIRFTKFDTENKLHRYFCDVAFITASMYGKKIYLPINPIKAIIYVIQTYGWKNLSYFKFINTNIITSIDIDNTLSYEAEQNDVPLSMFEDIYKAYYERLHKK